MSEMLSACVRDGDSWHQSADFSWCSSTATICGARRPEEQSRPFTVPDSCGFTCHDVDVGEERQMWEVSRGPFLLRRSSAPGLPGHPTFNQERNYITQTPTHSTPHHFSIRHAGAPCMVTIPWSLKSYITWRQLIGTLLHRSRILSVVRQRRSIPKEDASVHRGKAYMRW
jgi:hypothetical protein